MDSDHGLLNRAARIRRGRPSPAAGRPSCGGILRNRSLAPFSSSGPWKTFHTDKLLPDADCDEVVARHCDAELGLEAIVVGDEIAFQALAALQIEVRRQ